MVIFHSYVSLPEGTSYAQPNRVFRLQNHRSQVLSTLHPPRGDEIPPPTPEVPNRRGLRQGGLHGDLALAKCHQGPGTDGDLKWQSGHKKNGGHRSQLHSDSNLFFSHMFSGLTLTYPSLFSIPNSRCLETSEKEEKSKFASILV